MWGLLSFRNSEDRAGGSKLFGNNPSNPFLFLPLNVCIYFGHFYEQHFIPSPLADLDLAPPPPEEGPWGPGRHCKYQAQRPVSSPQVGRPLSATVLPQEPHPRAACSVQRAPRNPGAGPSHGDVEGKVQDWGSLAACVWSVEVKAFFCPQGHSLGESTSQLSLKPASSFLGDHPFVLDAGSS